jgi:raffinose/stachyose/melibiose transport system permease protein
MSRKSRIIHAFIQLFLLVFLLIYLSPLFLVGINAFKSYQEIMTDVMSMPQHLTLENFKTVFTDMKYPSTFLNTLIVTVGGTAGIVIISSMAGYKMARVKTRYSRLMFLYCIAPMMIPFQSFMLTLVNVATILNINGKIWGLAIIYWGLGAPMAIFLYQGFAKGIPVELEESALIDGCNQFQLFTRIVFPMLKSSTATVIIINVMWIWNDFLLPLLILGGRKSSKTLQLAAYSFMGQYKMEWQNIMAAAILIIIPALIIYLIFQKYIIKGVVAGAVKG